jgi:hypothetical protein
MLAGKLHGDYGMGMTLVAGAGAVAFALLAAFGPEAKEVRMTADSGSKIATQQSANTMASARAPTD